MSTAGVHNEFSGTAEVVIQGRDFMGPVVINTDTTRPISRLEMVPARIHGLVPRPELIGQVVARLSSTPPANRVMLTGIVGAGGYGKTTIASESCRDPRVAQRFPDGILWITLGEDVSGTALTSKVNDLATHLSGRRPLFTDVEQAGHHLGQLLSNKRCLLVIDDVWRSSQLTPFLLGAPQCARLVTTRVRAALPDDVESVVVDVMTPDEARTLLGHGLPPVAPRDLEPLLARTGAWPVLLRLANSAVRRYVRQGALVTDAVTRIIDHLAVHGPAAVDMTRSDQRDMAVTATVEASLSLLEQTNSHWLNRYLELAVFPENVAIPQAVLVTYWRHVGGLSPIEVEQLCLELADLSLTQTYEHGQAPALRLHDVMREYLRHRAGSAIVLMHRALLGAHRANLPTHMPVGGSTPAVEWWQLPETEPYLWRQLARHLHEADLADELHSLVCDFRWLQAVLRQYGPAAVETDLSYATRPLAHKLRLAVTHNAHLLAPIAPANSLEATFLSRLHAYADLAVTPSLSIALLTRPYLYPAWPLPDVPR